jgi:hypothetical protein
MRVWVNSSDAGWVQHGQDRSDEARALAVAKLLARRKGWETAAGATVPAPKPAGAGAPTAQEARKSPASFDSPEPRHVGGTVHDGRGESGAAADDDGEPYLEELASFALEGQLRDFLIGRLPRLTIGGMQLRLYRDAAGRSGREYPTDVGPIDILAIAPDNTVVVIELKRDRGPDRALGQLARYMGWVRTHLAAGAAVRGVVVARRIDDKLRYAAAAMPGVLLLEYDIRFDVREVSPF